MIDPLDIYPGVYSGRWERIETSRIIIFVEGTALGYLFDVMEHLGAGEGRFIKDVKLHKNPMIFEDRLTQLDKEE